MNFTYPFSYRIGARQTEFRVELTPHANGTWLTVSGRCQVTQEQHSIKVLRAGFEAWFRGRQPGATYRPLIQDCLPNASPDEREFLMSGTSPAGWKRMF